MAATQHKEDGSGLWFGIVVGLVVLVTVIAAALILGPPRDEVRGFRFEPPGPSQPRMPDPPKLPRQVI